MFCDVFFVFKQKTAYEMRISDWSSDVCSSDLPKTQRNGALTGPFAPKMVALWLSAWNLGVAHNRHEHALIAFVERQTGIAHVNWVRDQRDGAAAVEEIGRDTSELQSLMRISYAVFCSKNKIQPIFTASLTL